MDHVDQSLRLFVEHAPAAIAMLDRDMNYLLTSRRWRRDYQLGDAPLAGRNHYEVFPDLPERWLAIHRRCLAGAVERCEEDPFSRADGTTQWVRWEVRPWHREDGAIGGIIIFSEVITERKRLEQELARSQALMASILNGTTDAVYVKDLEGRYLFLNDAAAQVVGKPSQEVLGQDDTHLFPPEEVDPIQAGDREVLAGGGVTTYEERITDGDGQLRIFLTTKGPILGPAGTPIALFGIARDITEREQAAEDLRRAKEAAESGERALKAITDQATDGIALADLEGRYLFVNPAFCRMTGYTEEELLGLTVFQVRSPHQTGKTFFENRESMQGALIPVTIRRKDGVEIFTEIIGTTIEINGEARVLGTVRDVTERRRAEEARADLQARLLQSQKMEGLGTLAGGIAHDMNNVLGAILGLASANLETVQPGTPTYRAFETIAKAASRGGETVKGLLTFARTCPVELGELDANALLKEAAGLLEHTTLAKVTLELDLDPALRPIRGDAAALSHALMNLCINGVDAMPGGGVLRLRSRNLEAGWIELAVQDGGVGMPQETLNHALEPFFTTKGVGKGTGLGLTLVYSTATAHGGQVQIDSEPGQGTTVRLRLPALPSARPARPEQPTCATGTPGQSRSVLLVDDDPLIQDALGMMVGSLGHAVSLCPSGESALARIDGGLRPDLVLLDLNMPGLGGVATLPLLRQRLPGVPVLVTTGRADQTALDLAEAHASVRLLPKPFDLAAIQAAFQAFGL